MSVGVVYHLNSVTDALRDKLRGESQFNQQGDMRMPLRYNYDKPEKPRRIKGFEVFSLVFHPFPNRKITLK